MQTGWLLSVVMLLMGQHLVKDAQPATEVARERLNRKEKSRLYVRGAIVRGDTSQRELALVFTGDEFAEGGEAVRQVLKKHRVRASFFLTGRFYRNPAFTSLIRQLRRDGHYLGAHSDQHLLYCDWTRRDSLLVSRSEFRNDLSRNYSAMGRFGVRKPEAPYFLPPYEWYNDTIAAWTRSEGLQLVNYTSGTLSHADYTTPDARNYRSSEVILQSIYQYEKNHRAGLNGFLLLMHIGTDPRRTDKLYARLEELLSYLREKGYQLKRVDELL